MHLAPASLAPPLKSWSRDLRPANIHLLAKSIHLLQLTTLPASSVAGGVCLSLLGVKTETGFSERKSQLANSLAALNPESPSQEMTQRNVPAEIRMPADQWLSSVRTKFIRGVSPPVLNDLPDKLFESEVISESERTSVRTKHQIEEKAREVVDAVRRKGAAACRVLITALSDQDP
ncbi:hypothetical protein NQZ68_030670 [Dissostichus eleginoides]|nr:hypothetical protein NQZ68_030670 [Dissostichus eleginoides]